MNTLQLISQIELINGKVTGSDIDAVELCRYYSNYGADGIVIFEASSTDEEHELNIDTVKEIVTAVDIPVYLGGNIKRLEDVKKYLYAGATMAILDLSKEENVAMVKEAADRFGKEKTMIYASTAKSRDYVSKAIEDGATILLTDDEDSTKYSIPTIYAKTKKDISGIASTYTEDTFGFTYTLSEKPVDYMSLKNKLSECNIPVNITKCFMEFSDLKVDDKGLVPVVVQDYQTNEVLMLAYMNEEAFNKTIETGRMTYYSRSRSELWEKGLTSGHFQYLKSLEIDCDNDTLLAKVYQVGAACHTNNRSCFYRNIYKKDYKDNNPHKVFEDVYNVILDRKINPKEGSYTNYLFDKGIDKILKKVGEEATEIVIAAKNPNPEEIKYEISDFLYHVMVLMAERNVTWEDVTTELSRR